MPETSTKPQITTASTPENVLRLQSLVGNQATQRILQAGRPPLHLSAMETRDQAPISQRFLIQRLLITGTQFLKKTTDEEMRFQKIANVLDEYNIIATEYTDKEFEPFKRGFDKLRQLDRLIYAWFDDVTKNYVSLAEAPHYKQMENLRLQSQKEYEILINWTRKNDDFLPFDLTDMEKNEIEDLRKLWQSIVRGDGKIQLVGSTAFNRSALAQLAKILQTKTGRELLGYLNTPSEAEFSSGEKKEPKFDPMTNVYIGERIKQLPLEVRKSSPQVKDVKHSEAQALGVGKDEITAEELHGMSAPVDLTGKEDLSEFKVINNANELHKFRKAVLQGKKGIIYNGKKYLFNKSGSGAFVTAFEGLSTLPGEANHQIVGPGFVTLGHELGHVANMRGGASSVHLVLDQLMKLGGNKSLELWQNPEELFTIKNIENAIRSESGISERTSHVPYKSFLWLPRHEKLKNRFTKRFDKEDSMWMQEPKVEAFYEEKLNKNVWAKTLSDDSAYIKAKKRTEQLNEAGQ